MELGVAYYPEHYEETRWKKDIILMQKAGIKKVRLGEFAWSKMEAAENAFNFSWLDKVINLFSKHNIKVILCTPTTTYPPWLHIKFPDIHQIKSNGIVKEFGERQDACKNHPGYRQYSLRVTKELAKSVGRNKNVIAWQTDNELGNHTSTYCYCRYCEKEFQEWLKIYFNNDIDSLNSAWGTEFWSQHYNCFDEVQVPRDTGDMKSGFGHNPGLVLAFYRFSSDVQVNYQDELIKIIREHSPDRIITHNCMKNFFDINYYDLAKNLDVASWGNYPFYELQGTYRQPGSFPHAFIRGLKQKNFWIMEQAAGPGGWETMFPNLDPGIMRLWTYQSLGCGAEFINYFRWRTSRFGTEQYWHGILPHHGNPERRYNELQDICMEFEKLSPALTGSEKSNKIAILFDHDTCWALNIQPHVPKSLTYGERCEQFYKVLNEVGIETDIIFPESDFSKYSFIVCPSVYICTKELASKLTGYVKDGGKLLIGPRSGVKDKDNGVVEMYLPGLLSDVCGLTIKEYDAFGGIPDFEMTVKLNNDKNVKAEWVADILEPVESAEVLGTYNKRYYKGKPCIASFNYGAGKSFYLGAFFDDNGLYEVLRMILKIIEIKEISKPNGDIEVISLRKKDKVYRFYLNYSDSMKKVKVYKNGINLISNQKVNNTLELLPKELGIIEEEVN